MCPELTIEEGFGQLTFSGQERKRLKPGYDEILGKDKERKNPQYV